MAKIEPGMLCRLMRSDNPNAIGIMVLVEKKIGLISTRFHGIQDCWGIETLQSVLDRNGSYLHAPGRHCAAPESWLQPIPPLSDEDETPREVDLPVPSEETTL